MGLGRADGVVEKVPRGTEPEFALEVLEDRAATRSTRCCPSEAGGWNSLHPMLPAARRGLPLLDGDGMGRAFPELQMVTWSVFGQSASPIGVADERGNRMLVETDDNERGEDLCRGATVMMGGNISLACYPMTGAQARANSVAGTYTLCEEVGALLRYARTNRVDAYDKVTERLGAIELFRGKVQDVERRTTGGFARGIAVLEGFDAYRNSTFAMEFQNEFLMARRDGVPVCTAPRPDRRLRRAKRSRRLRANRSNTDVARSCWASRARRSGARPRAWPSWGLPHSATRACNTCPVERR